MRKCFFRLWEILWLGQTQMTISIGERPYIWEFTGMAIGLIDPCKSSPDVGCFLLGTIATLAELSRRRDELPRVELPEGELPKGELPRSGPSTGVRSTVKLTSLSFTDVSLWEASLDGFCFSRFAQRCWPRLIWFELVWAAWAELFWAKLSLAELVWAAWAKLSLASWTLFRGDRVLPPPIDFWTIRPHCDTWKRIVFTRMIRIKGDNVKKVNTSYFSKIILTKVKI